MKTIFLVSQGRKLQARLYTPIKPASKAVLIIHGYQSNQASYQSRAEALCELGLTCLSVDLSGHGESEGDLEELSISNHLQDVLTAYECLASQEGVDAGQIAAFGASYGGFLSILLSAERSVSHLLLRVPAMYQDELFSLPHKEWDREALITFRQNITPDTPNRALQAVRNCSGPVLVVESGLDDQVPHSVIAAYAGNIQHGGVVVMPNTKHSLEDATSQQAFMQILTAWGKSL